MNVWDRSWGWVWEGNMVVLLMKLDMKSGDDIDGGVVACFVAYNIYLPTTYHLPTPTPTIYLRLPTWSLPP